MTNAFKLTERCSLALQSMSFLAKEVEAVHTAHEVATQLGVSANHLSKVFHRLSRANLISSVRGSNGGNHLARVRSDITLLQIYEAVEGEFSFGKCFAGKNGCESDGCLLGKLIERANLAIYNELSQTTLKQVSSRKEKYCIRDKPLFADEDPAAFHHSTNTGREG